MYSLIIDFARPFSGVEITDGPSGGVRITVPFSDRNSAEEARSEITITIEAERKVIQGEVIR